MADDDLVYEVGEPGSIGTLLFTEEPAPPGERCNVELHIGPTGVWTCQRQRGHDGPCWSTGSVELPDA